MDMLMYVPVAITWYRYRYVLPYLTYCNMPPFS